MGAKEIRLLTIADLHWHSGIEYALQAIAVLAEAGHSVHYRIIGQGKFLEAVVWAIREMKLHGLVELVTDLPSSRIFSELKQADAFLFPAVYPVELIYLNAILESQTPIVSTNAVPNVTHIPANLYIAVPKRDPNAIAYAVKRLHSE